MLLFVRISQTNDATGRFSLVSSVSKFPLIESTLSLVIFLITSGTLVNLFSLKNRISNDGASASIAEGRSVRELLFRSSFFTDLNLDHTSISSGRFMCSHFDMFNSSASSSFHTGYVARLHLSKVLKSDPFRARYVAFFLNVNTTKPASAAKLMIIAFVHSAAGLALILRRTKKRILRRTCMIVMALELRLGLIKTSDDSGKRKEGRGAARPFYLSYQLF
ncbi:hypothetical protein ACHAWO_002355 [Cyclotella atomus]|uniref:Uncharacterized protein n=1 Tax=Cyclotella atomus TaxID=382360 RepID=A0ABD3Q3B9_9STRA